MSDIGKNLRARAQELGWSNAEVARRVGITARRYHRYVNDEREPDFQTLRKICEVLQMDFNEVFR